MKIDEDQDPLLDLGIHPDIIDFGESKINRQPPREYSGVLFMKLDRNTDPTKVNGAGLCEAVTAMSGVYSASEFSIDSSELIDMPAILDYLIGNLRDRLEQEDVTGKVLILVTGGLIDTIQEEEMDYFVPEEEEAETMLFKSNGTVLL